MSRDEPTTRAPFPVGVVIFALFLMAGYFKAAPGFEALPVDLTALFAALTFCACLLTVVRGDFRPSGGFAAMALLFGLFAVPVLWMDWLTYTTEKATRLFTLTMLSAMAPFFLFRTKRDVLAFLYTLAGLGLVMCAGAASSLASGQPVERLSAFGSNTIALGRAASMAVLWFALLALERRMPTALALGVVTFSTALLLCSGARGPLLTVVGILAILAVTYYRHQLARIVVATVILGSLGAGFMYAGEMGMQIVPRTSYLRVNSFLQGEIDTSGEGRLDFYNRAMTRIPDAPFGLGWGGFGTKLGPHAGESRDYPHNLVLEVALEAGWLSGGILILICGGAVRRLVVLRRYQQARGVLAFFLLCLANAMVSGDINDNRAFFALLGLALALRPMAGQVPLRGRLRLPGRLPRWSAGNRLSGALTLSPAQQAYMCTFRRSALSASSDT